MQPLAYPSIGCKHFTVEFFTVSAFCKFILYHTAFLTIKLIQIIMSVHQIVDHCFEFLILYSHIHPHHFPWSQECIEKGKPVLSDTIKLLPLTSSASLRSSSVFCVHPHLSHPISPIIHLAHPSGQAAYHLRQRTVRLKFRMHHRFFPGSVL